MFFSELNPRWLQFCHIRLQVPIITILWNYKGFPVFLISIKDFGEGSFCLIKSQNMRIYLSCLKWLYFDNPMLVTHRQIWILVKVFIFVSILLQGKPIFPFFLRSLFLFFHLRVQRNFRSILLAHPNQLKDCFIFREGQEVCIPSFVLRPHRYSL